MSLLWQLSPYTYSIAAGCLELLSYSSTPLFLWLSSLATLPIMLCAYLYGWRSGVLTAMMAAGVAGLIIFIKPSLLSDTPLFRVAVATPLKFLLPVFVGSMLSRIPRPTSSATVPPPLAWCTMADAIIRRVINGIGLMALLLLVVIVVYLSVDVGIADIMLILRDNVMAYPSVADDPAQLLQKYLSIVQLLPGIELFELMKSLTLQALFVTALGFWQGKAFAQWHHILGRVHLERFWLPLLGLLLLGMVVPLTATWAYFSTNAIFIILFLFLISGSDIVYRHLRCRDVPGVYIAVIFVICLAIGFPLALFMVIGLVDQFYTLKPNLRK